MPRDCFTEAPREGVIGARDFGTQLRKSTRQNCVRLHHTGHVKLPERMIAMAVSLQRQRKEQRRSHVGRGFSRVCDARCWILLQRSGEIRRAPGYAVSKKPTMTKGATTTGNIGRDSALRIALRFWRSSVEQPGRPSIRREVLPPLSQAGEVRMTVWACELERNNWESPFRRDLGGTCRCTGGVFDYTIGITGKSLQRSTKQSPIISNVSRQEASYLNRSVIMCR